jgi:hypothetical protein
VGGESRRDLGGRIAESDSASGQSVEVGGFGFGRADIADIIGPEGVKSDEEDMGRRLGGTTARGSRQGRG